MKRVTVFLLVSLSLNLLYTQEISNIEKRAILFTYSDIAYFYIDSDIKALEDIINMFDIVSLKSKNILECKFFKVSWKEDSKGCTFILAYSSSTKRFYRLMGFSFNEFNDFYNSELLGGSVVFHSQKNGLKAKYRYIIKKVWIEGLNIKQLYQTYYKKYKNCTYDKTSCYRQNLIIAY